MDIQNNEQHKIFETEFWLVKLNADDQTYLGRSVIVLKRPCPDLADVTDQELLDFKAIVIRMEQAFRRAFNATMFNWSCLMNDAYKNDPPNPQLHWHVRPRYKNKVEFEGEVFEDIEFGNAAIREAKRSAGEVMNLKIIEKIKSSLNE